MQFGAASHAALNAVGVAATGPDVAGTFQLASTVPFACVVFASAGFAPWQIEQSNGDAEFSPSAGLRWASCAPTLGIVKLVAPFVSTPVPPYPGAEFQKLAPELSTAAPLTPASVPWQAVHPLFGLSDAAFVQPLMCVVFAPTVTPDVAYPVPWQLTHVVFCGWFSPTAALTGGAAPWHVPHAACDTPAFQTGARLLPPASAPPGE